MPKDNNRIVFGIANKPSSIAGATALLAIILFAPFNFAVFARSSQSLERAKGISFAQASPLYRQLVERVKKGDTTVDFVQLRQAYADWVRDSKNETDAPDRDAMVKAFEKEDYAKAVTLVEIVLDYEFLHTGLHGAAEDAYRKLGNEAKASFHREVKEKLIQALLNTGDGKTPATAYRVLSVKEEYLIMRQLNYMKDGNFMSQALMSIDGKPYDVLTGIDPKTGQRIEVYFDISHFFGGHKKTK